MMTSGVAVQRDDGELVKELDALDLSTRVLRSKERVGLRRASREPGRRSVRRDLASYA